MHHKPKSKGKKNVKTPTSSKKHTYKMAKMGAKAVKHQVATMTAKAKATDDDSSGEDESEDTLEKINEI